MKSHLFFALEDEVDPRFDEIRSQITVMGMGKLNAALSLANFLHLRGSVGDLFVINLGTAGSQKFPVGSLLEISDFYERGITFRSSSIKQDKHWTSLPKGKCGSGDILEPFNNKRPWDCVDMEAYALAKICWAKKIPFVSIKYITDSSDKNTIEDWEKNLILAKENLFQFWNSELKSKSF